jgi:hypothetical protein
VEAYLTGYRTGLVLAAALVLAGGAAAYGALRGAHGETPHETSHEDLVLAG